MNHTPPLKRKLLVLIKTKFIWLFLILFMLFARTK